MDRRGFSLGLGAAFLGGAMTSQALAGADSSFVQGSLRALRLRFADGGFRTLDGYVITDSQHSYGVSWTQHLPTYFEDRVNLSGSGLGGLFRTPFRVRWAQGLNVGSVDLIGSRLVAQANAIAGYGNTGVTVGAGDYSWDLPQGLSAGPPVGGGGRRVGSVRLGDDGRMLVSLDATPAF